MKARIEIEFEDRSVRDSIDYIYNAYLDAVKLTVWPFPSFRSSIDGKRYPTLPE